MLMNYNQARQLQQNATVKGFLNSDTHNIVDFKSTAIVLDPETLPYVTSRQSCGQIVTSATPS